MKIHEISSGIQEGLACHNDPDVLLLNNACNLYPFDGSVNLWKLDSEEVIKNEEFCEQRAWSNHSK